MARTARKVEGRVRVGVSGNAFVDSVAVGHYIHHVLQLEELREEGEERGWGGRNVEVEWSGGWPSTAYITVAGNIAQGWMEMRGVSLSG